MHTLKGQPRSEARKFTQSKQSRSCGPGVFATLDAIDGAGC